MNLTHRCARALFCCALLFVLLLVRTEIHAQEQQPAAFTQTFHIVDIKVEGNKKTHPSVILREMKTQTGDTATLQQLELDQKRIASLGLFSRVEMRAEPNADGISLIIIVAEQWYIFPLPVFYFNDREFTLEKLTYGAAVAHTNFRGRAEFLQASALFGYNPSFSIDYANPWIFGDTRLYMRMNFFKSRFRNKSSEIRDTNIDENRIGGGFTLGKRLTLNTSLSLSLSYRQLRISPPDSTLTLNPSGRDRLPQAALTFTRDYRDFVFYPTRGSYFRFMLQKTGVPNDRYVDYGRLVLDLRKYFPLGEQSTFGLAFEANMSRGELPSYDRVFFGFSERLRGYFNDRVEGEHSMKASAELRFPLLPVTYQNMDSETLGAYGQNLKFGISGSVFFDTGTLWLQKREGRSDFSDFTTGVFGPQTSSNKWVFGYGVGLNFHLPYVHIARVEFAANDLGQTELTFDVGVAF